ncbi:MAG: PIN domain nuclease [Candidatus Rokuibacteriota bacterium]|nr:MAG: PIN domain nuclease [Candidatus Rokubacteria bacterium]
MTARRGSARRPPRRSTARRATVVVDASVAVQWFANEPGAAAAARLLERDDVLVAPDLMTVEAANAWRKKTRRLEMSRADLEQAVASLLALDIEWVPTRGLAMLAARQALEIGHPVYDCLYLALAGQRSARLATVDDRLRRLAARVGVDLWGP